MKHTDKGTNSSISLDIERYEVVKLWNKIKKKCEHAYKNFFEKDLFRLLAV